MTCLQDCRSFHYWRSVNQRLLKVKCAEFMGSFSKRETFLMDLILQSVCKGLIRHSCRKEGNPLIVCKQRNIVNTSFYSLRDDFLISLLQPRSMMLTTSSLKSSQQMKSTITCKQLRLQSVQSGSKQFRQLLGLENEDDLPARRQTTEIHYSEQKFQHFTERKQDHPERFPKASRLGVRVGSKFQYYSGH